MRGDCERARQWASTELDDELSEFEQALLEGHLASCPACREFHAEIGRFTGALRAVPAERFEGDLEIRRIGRRRRLRLAPVVAAMAVTAVGLGSILASSEVRPGSEVNGPGQSSSVDSIASTPSGLINLTILQERTKGESDKPSAVNIRRSKRPVSGGLVLNQ